jgi:hypothetical protein
LYAIGNRSLVQPIEFVRVARRHHGSPQLQCRGQFARLDRPLFIQDNKFLHLLRPRYSGIGLRDRLLDRRQYLRFARELCPITVEDAPAGRV